MFRFGEAYPRFVLARLP